MYSLFNNLYDPFPLFGRSVYVLSDSDYQKYRVAQVEREIKSLEEIKEGHLRNIEQVNVTIEKLKADLPKLPATDEKE